MFKQQFINYIALNQKMKSIKLLLFSLFVTVLGSCVNNEDVQLETYPEKEVILNTKTLISTTDIPFARIQADPEFPDYVHLLPAQFNVYFVATTGNDQNKVIKKFEGLGAGSHSLIVPSRPYRVVVTNSNFNTATTGDQIRRNLLPEYSSTIYLYGESNIDYKASNEGSVSVTNDYAASLILKSAMVKSIPVMQGTSYFTTDDYYIIYLRDQSGQISIARNTTLQVLNTAGGTTHYNLSHTYTANNISRFHFKLYDETDGSFNIVVDENILKAIEDKVIVPNS